MAFAGKPKKRKAREIPAAAPDAAYRVRIRVVFWLLLLGFVSVGVRLIDVQGSPDFELNDDTGFTDIVIPRGRIYDGEGRILARDRLAHNLWVDPSAVDDPDTMARQLGFLLGVDEEQMRQRLTQRDANGDPRQFAYVKRWLTDEELELLGDVDALAGGALRAEWQYARDYPERDLAAHVVGFVNRERLGCEGIEARYNKHLFSVPGKRTSRVDAWRRPLASLTLENTPPEGGEDVHLTILKPLQYALERELAAAMERCKAPRAMGLLLDPHTGAILALACLPAFDPNEYWEYPAENRKNRAVTDVFEPGSSFKIVTAAAALEEGLITPSTPIDCEGGCFNPYGHRIRDVHGLETVPFWRAFAESSNIAIIKVAGLLEPPRLEKWIRAFGFGERACRDFQTESPGIFRPKERWSRLSMGSLPMGQEVAVTMPQLARAYAAIANGGFLVEPHLVSHVQGRDGVKIQEYAAPAPKRILSRETAETMRQLCHLVIAYKHGTGRRYANIPEFRAGGKTGTAQIARPDGKGYYKDKYTTVFAGFAPVRNPQVCAVIVVSEPDIDLHYGGYVCGPVFQRVVREALILLNCPPDPVGERAPGFDWLPPASEMTPAPAPLVARVNCEPEAISSEEFAPPVAKERDPDTVVLRDTIEELEPSDADILADLDGLELITPETDEDNDGPVLPDFRGMTRHQAKNELALLGLNWDAQGSGWVVAQEPKPGTPIGDVALCKLILSNKRG